MDEARHDLSNIIVSLGHTVEPRVQVCVNEAHRSVNEIKSNLDCALVPIHTFVASCESVCGDIGDERTQFLAYENRQMSRLEADGRDHDEVRSKALLNHQVHLLLRRGKHRFHDRAEGLLCSNDIDVVVNVLWMQQANDIVRIWLLASDVPGHSEDTHAVSLEWVDFICQVVIVSRPLENGCLRNQIRLGHQIVKKSSRSTYEVFQGVP